MATGEQIPVCLLSCFSILLIIPTFIHCEVLTPPYFNLAKGRNITATATCGVGVPNPELYCRLTGTAGVNRGSSLESLELIQGQFCDYCSPERSDRDHRPQYAIDGTERWWQSPPLSRIGLELNKVNLSISLGQEFHVAYVFIKMANSPRPGVWVLERSLNFGKSFLPWQYFADTPSDCINFFNVMADQRLVSDDQILCSTEFSKVVPLSNGEIVISLVNDRPSSHNFSYATTLQQWTKATDVRLRLLRTKNLLGHLMAIAREDPTVTRRYYYSIKDISIGGRCVCNGHAETCDTPDPASYKLLCDCQHNTCGAQCDHCCPGFTQKRWRRALIDQPFECEPCECYGHSNVCVFDEEVETNRLSIDIHGNYEGGGVCQNCSHNTKGINCEQCIPTFYRPYDVPRNSVDACRPCECDLKVSTGECEEGSGRCLCRPEYAGVNCDRCNFGYHGYPDCVPCDCNIIGTEGEICTVTTGNCPCKSNFAGPKCDQCALGYFNFSDCQPCECNPVGCPSSVCDQDGGQCDCQINFGGRDCGECAHGYFQFPRCDFCGCDASGTETESCDKEVGNCLCRPNYDGDYCDRCKPGFYDFPVCIECQCEDVGSLSPICAANGQCRCKPNYGGMNCDRCAAGFYRYPDCAPCNCDLYGSYSRSCDQVTGQCDCRSNFVGLMCDKCGEDFYNYPMCEVCNCNPNGAKEIPGYPLGGCGIVTSGLLCECKDKVQGRTCDQCKAGYWNLDRNNPEGCEECGCHKPGTLLGLNRCDMYSGQCMCKPNVGGQDCNRCLDGFYDLSEDNPFGCQDCNCDRGGSQQLTCNKMTGQCLCKPRVSGKRCDQPVSGHFYPSLHQYKYEIEDGKTPEGARIRYGYDERIFPGFSWRGYAILTQIQPEVLLDVDIRIPSLYQVIFSFVNKENNPVKGTITLTPESPTEITQSGEIVFVPSREPKFASVSGGGVQSFVLNPGRWTVSTNVPDNIFLDYFVLIPQAYYEATQIQQTVTNPCSVPDDPGPCVHFGYPDLSGYPNSFGRDGYVVVGTGDERPVVQLPDTDIVVQLGSSGLAHVNESQDSFLIDLRVPDPGNYLIVLSYYNPKDKSQELDIEVATPAGRQEAIATLSSCKLSTLCRQVLKTIDGKEAIFNISSGFATLYITGKDDVDVGIESVYVIPVEVWNPDYILPRIICIKVNGICVPSTYGRPVGAVRIDFEQPPNENLTAEKLPPNILDPSVGLVNLNDTVKTGLPLELFGSVTKTGQYIFLVHYYMPNEVQLNIPVTVFVDGKISTGVFNPGFCANVVGCRSTIVFGQSGTAVIKLPETDVRVLFNNTRGGQIWLDYLLIVPANQYSGHFLEHLPVDKSGDFLTNCVNEGFQVKKDDVFCKEGAFTLTTNFNNGALDCGCNADGSLSFTCESYAGQCDCRENIIGRTCTACRPDYFGFPNCQPCSCPYGLCEEVTGQCICPDLVTGDRCDMCEPEAYGYDALIGCQQCNCDYNGVEDGDLNCDQTTGQCRCKANIGGRRCDTCLPGFHSFPYCQDCGCDRNGTMDDICDQTSAQCLCKDNVEGQYCDMCKEGMFSLSDSNPNGCTKCFCFGHTSRCSSAGLNWEELADMTGWLATNSGDQEVQEAGNTVRVSSLEDETEDGVLYWIAPRIYLGRKIMSYGGSLKFTVLFTLPRNKDSEGFVKPDVILTGSNMTIIHFHDSQPAPSIPHMMDIPLLEFNFIHEETNSPVTREQFMMLLSNIDALLIRASYYTVVGEIRLTDVIMEVASENDMGEASETVEMCQCPSNYQGLSCEECSPGHYRARSTPYLGICTKCNCNGHTEECNVETGECYNCGDNTTGPHCEKCITGYYGDPATGGCQICSCPLPIASNNFATTCDVSDGGFTSSCSCNPGYTGDLCDSCASGYYGNPMAVGEFCQPCDCSDNIDRSDPNSCDKFTGACLQCANYTAGLNCDMCGDWYWGDAIARKDCQACTCDRCGSDSCDKNVGLCQCKPNVEGPDCDKCRPNTWGFEMCKGCQECGCGIGSETQQCDLLSGLCHCQPGVEGEKCDRCEAGYWNYGPSGCEVCNCLIDGAVGCNPANGRCICIQGVTGETCDKCLPRWVLAPNGAGCQECDYCVHLLMDDLDYLKQNVSVISRLLGEVSVGIGAFNRLNEYNETAADLRPEVDALELIDNNTFSDMLEPIEAEIEVLRQDCKSNHSMSESIQFESAQLPDEVQDFVTKAAEAEKLTQDLNTIAEETLKHIEAVRLQILDPGNTRNLDYFITEGKRIVQEIEARNFSGQNDSAVQEKDNANMALEDVKQLKMDVAINMNKTANLRLDVEDLSSRVADLQNSSRYLAADSDSTMNTIRRLKAVQIESLSRSLKTLEERTKDTEDMLKTGNELVMEAEKMLKASDDAVQGVEVVSSQLDSAIPELELRVNEIADSIEDLYTKYNDSWIHASNLAQMAEDMNEMYASTRNISENAVKAGQAYDTILDAVTEARNSSLQALIDAETTLTESMGIESNVSTSLQESKDLLDDVDSLQEMINSDVKKKVNDAEDQLLKSEESSMKVRDELEKVNKKMEQLDASTSGLADKIMMDVNDADKEVDKAIAVSKPISDQMPTNRDKMNFVVQNIPKAEDDLRETQDNVDSTKASQPEVNDLLSKLSVNAKNLSTKGRLLGLDVEALKEKIAQARHEANMIRVGLKYIGNTTVTLRNPPKLEDTGSFTTVSLFSKTTQSDGLLMYVGNNLNSASGEDNRAKRQADSSIQRTHDYLALEVRDGSVVFTYDLGTGPAVITSDRKVNDGKWHQIICNRIGKSGTLTVKSNEVDDEVKEGTSKGMNTVLELNPITTMFIVGGVPANAKIPGALSNNFFEGSMEELKFDGEPLGLWNFVEGAGNNQGEKQRDFMQEAFVEGTRFSGMGYVVLSKDGLSLKPDRTKVSFFFKTYAEEGLLFYMGNQDYFAIDMRRGRVMFQYDLGGGAAVMESQDTYNDGEWHKVRIDRDKKKAVLIIDDTKTIRGESKGSLNNLETTNSVYLGGIDNGVIPSSNVVSTGFDGCMKDITIGSLAVDLTDNRRAKGIIAGCTAKVTRVVSFPTSKGAYVALKPVNIGSMFDVTFKFKTLKKDALLVYTSDDSQTNTFAVSLKDGSIVVTEELGSRTQELRSRVNTFGDGNWHYVSVMKMGQKLTLGIDDTRLIEGESIPGLMTTSDLYFGGLPYKYKVTSQALVYSGGVEGCLGDITVNKKFQNLAHQENEGISFAECSLEKTVKPTINPNLKPDQCALPQIASDFSFDGANVKGVRFGADPHSRQEFKKIPVRIRIKPVTVAVSFKTSADRGVIFYTSDRGHTDFFGIYMLHGQVNYGFNCGSGAAHINSPGTYNDGKWHTLKVARRGLRGTLEIDGIRVGAGKSRGSLKSLNTRPPYYLGGLREEVKEDASRNLGDVSTAFVGCLKDVSFNMLPLKGSSKDFNVQPCADSTESGTFVGVNGGNVKLYDTFKVGQKLDIVLDIKPRSTEGVLLAVHRAKGDFFLLQLSDGELILSTDNGAGIITTSYKPPSKNTLCDGHWHTIKASKNKHILSLTVDGKQAPLVEGQAKISSADTKNPLYIGGVEDQTAKGLVTTGTYVGCIRNLYLNGKLEYIGAGTSSGDVNLSSCPRT